MFILFILFLLLFIVDQPTAKLATFLILLMLVDNIHLQVISRLIIQNSKLLADAHPQKSFSDSTLSIYSALPLILMLVTNSGIITTLTLVIFCKNLSNYTYFSSHSTCDWMNNSAVKSTVAIA